MRTKLYLEVNPGFHDPIMNNFENNVRELFPESLDTVAQGDEILRKEYSAKYYYEEGDISIPDKIYFKTQEDMTKFILRFS